MKMTNQFLFINIFINYHYNSNLFYYYYYLNYEEHFNLFFFLLDLYYGMFLAKFLVR